MKIDENNLFEYIQSYVFLERETKEILLKYFYDLNDFQKKGLIDYFNKQKEENLEFLKSLKDKEVCSFEQIKTFFEEQSRKKLQFEEQSDFQNEQDDLNLLMRSLDNL